ncbi:MAG TPA: DUF664 domain-containing protein [Acidimicrobiales bacterium]|nr:DUF664 domain-containing protein [Acidimicrobiales bacterium]
MHTADLLDDAFGRIGDEVHRVVEGLTTEALAFRPDAQANSIAWLIWHLTRVQDDHVATVAGHEQAWTSEGWATRFGLPLMVADIGYGHDSEQVAAVTADAALLAGYYDSASALTTSFVSGLTDDDLDRVVDERWEPPVTLGVRLVSVIADALQHVGQAAYVRGLIERR